VGCGYKIGYKIGDVKGYLDGAAAEVFTRPQNGVKIG
jgi:hypothetical protein